MKKVAVIILNYKVKNQAIKCVRSVQKSDYQNIEIIVVDNNSDDGISEEIKKISGVKFIQNQENLGYTGGNNIGIKKALEGGADYVFILNPDTELNKTAISALVDCAEKESAGIVGPKILFEDQKTIWHAGGIFNKENVLGTHRGLDEKDYGQYEKVEEVDYISGAAVLVQRDVFKKVGLFDEKYFLYYEDSDFCFRAKQAGFKILYIPQAVVYHRNAQSTGLGSALQDYYITRNRMLLASKFLPFRTRFALFREVVKNLGNPVKRQAWWDFITGNLGKGSR